MNFPLKNASYKQSHMILIDILTHSFVLSKAVRLKSRFLERTYSYNLILSRPPLNLNMYPDRCRPLGSPCQISGLEEIAGHFLTN